MKKIVAIYLWLCTFFVNATFDKMVAIKPVVNLRTAPVDISEITFPASSVTNQYQGSQLLMGDIMHIKRKFLDSNGILWFYGNAAEQQRFSQDSGWHGFPGWVKAKDVASIKNVESAHVRVKQYVTPVYGDNQDLLFWLSVGTKLTLSKCDIEGWFKVDLLNGSHGYIQQDHVQDHGNTLDQNLLRTSIVHLAKQFLGTFYCWGGRSAQWSSFLVSGVDCSGLINIIFLAHHIMVPRTAHDQYMQAVKIAHGKDLKIADLVYICPVTNESQKSCRMTHVFLYIGDGMLLESTLSGNGKVRIISFKDRIGKDLLNCTSGDISASITSQGQLGTKYRIYFASFF